MVWFACVSTDFWLLWFLPFIKKYFVRVFYLILPQVTSLAGKVQAKEETATGQVPEPNQLDPVNMNPAIKTEDRLSSGSAVLDEDAPHQLRDSCDSYFPSIVPIHHHSGQDTNNNNGCGNDTGCFADVFVQGESFGLWGCWTWNFKSQSVYLYIVLCAFVLSSTVYVDVTLCINLWTNSAIPHGILSVIYFMFFMNTGFSLFF